MEPIQLPPRSNLYNPKELLQYKREELGIYKSQLRRANNEADPDWIADELAKQDLIIAEATRRKEELLEAHILAPDKVHDFTEKVARARLEIKVLANKEMIEKMKRLAERANELQEQMNAEIRKAEESQS